MDRADDDRPFRPLPLLGNPHVQTLLGHLLPGRRPAVAGRPRLLALSDGDRLVLHDHAPPRWRPGGRVALLVHGLGGSHRSGSVQRLAAALLPAGLRVVCLDLRGAGHGEGLARLPYHAGCSEDVRAALAEVHRWSPPSPLVLVGFSLGGNIVLKLAAEAAARPVANLERVAAVAPPIDLEVCAALLARPSNRLYDAYFVRALARATRRLQRLLPHLPPVRFPPQLTLRLFDELYTAPRWGFTDALDYYRRAAAAPLLHAPAAVRTFILAARDDPFVAAAPIAALPADPAREVHVVEHGGHLGFLGWDGGGGIRWAERRVADWILRG